MKFIHSFNHSCKLTLRRVLKASISVARIRLIFILILSASIISFPSLADDITVNRLLASQCAQCHGPNGKAIAGMDKLSDESAKDLYEDLRDMRREDSPEDIMDHQALGYTSDQIRRIADYYGFLSEKPGGGGEDDEDDDDEDDEDDDDEDDEDDEDDDDDDDDDDRR